VQGLLEARLRGIDSGGVAALEGLAQSRSGRLLRRVRRDPVAIALPEVATPDIERADRSRAAERASD